MKSDNIPYAQESVFYPAYGDVQYQLYHIIEDDNHSSSEVDELADAVRGAIAEVHVRVHRAYAYP